MSGFFSLYISESCHISISSLFYLMTLTMCHMLRSTLGWFLLSSSRSTISELLSFPADTLRHAMTSIYNPLILHVCQLHGQIPYQMKSLYRNRTIRNGVFLLRFKLCPIVRRLVFDRKLKADLCKSRLIQIRSLRGSCCTRISNGRNRTTPDWCIDDLGFRKFWPLIFKGSYFPGTDLRGAQTKLYQTWAQYRAVIDTWCWSFRF